MKLYNVFLLFYLSVYMCNLNALNVGDHAPDFSLLDENRELFKLSDCKGSFVVLYFYPKDDTPGCTEQACGLRDNFDVFKDNNSIVVGISYDTPEKHAFFKKKHTLPYKLLSDSQQDVAKSYGAKRPWYISWLVSMPKRITYIIDPNGKICGFLPHVTISTHVQEIVALIKKAQQ